MRSALRKLFRMVSANPPPPAEAPVAEIAITQEIFEHSSSLIGSMFTYFNDLSPELKQRFVHRVHQFKSTKKFHYVGLEEKDELAILVSSSAVQVTFGLKNYQMSHFKNIYILADAYRMENDDELYIGHVAPEGIYLSWKHFKYGYSNNHDNINVAVHEMSHALLYNNFFAQYGKDSHFRMNYEKFSTTTGPIFAEVITSRRSYLRSYAFSNLHEFWAVSVEAFFENPNSLHIHMPDLYMALCRVLNQDPSTKNKILMPEEA